MMKDKKRIVVFSGAGISEESGIKTFRGGNGLWEEYNIEDVATPEAWTRNQELVLDFYNKRRRQVVTAQPNAAHHGIAALEKKYDVHVITQNIDDLHERAGSKKILHLHGEILKSRSTADHRLVYEIKGTELRKGEKCEKGSQLRPAYRLVWRRSSQYGTGLHDGSIGRYFNYCRNFIECLSCRRACKLCLSGLHKIFDRPKFGSL
jgi:NAD-dependent deacetylase